MVPQKLSGPNHLFKCWKYRYYALQDLIEYLHDYGIITLQDAINQFMESQSYWMSVDDLEMGGSWAHCWNEFIEGLKNGGIKLKPFADRILWVQNKRDSMVTVTLVYDLLAKTYLDSHCASPVAWIWQGSFPLLIK